MSDKKKIIIIQPIHEAGIELLKDNPNYEYEILEDLENTDIKSKISSCDAISIRTAKLSGELINYSKNLKIISRHGVGYDNIDLNYIKNNNISLLITATANASAVAEHVVSLILSLSKKTLNYDKEVRKGNFKNNSKKIKTIDLLNKEILIAGFGRIGKSLIKMCLGFDMKIKVFDPYVTEDVIKSFGGSKIENIDEGLSNCDFLSIHMPLNNETKNLINYSKIKKMKKNSIIINTARGGIINEKDLDKALNENLIFGAGLDVFVNEPIEKNSPLLKNEKIILSPHIATNTDECLSRMSVETTKNIIDFFDKKIDKSMIVKL